MVKLAEKKTDLRIASSHSAISNERAVCFKGDCMDFMAQVPDGVVQLIVTSPPYNIGKEYEKRQPLERYLEHQDKVIRESARVLKDGGSLCWQVGNHIAGDGEVYPLDAYIYHIGKKHGLKLRNRIIWHFGHGLHATKRFSGRYETILWFTKGDNYYFNLDPVRVPQKYPGKRNYKQGEKYGMLSGNPLGKNPSDIWEIPNVKSNHPEKTIHPCQFPIALIERLVLSMTQEGDIVYDPFMGVGSALCAAVMHGRVAWGSDIYQQYVDIARDRVSKAAKRELRIRPLDKPLYDAAQSNLAKLPEEFKKIRNST